MHDYVSFKLAVVADSHLIREGDKTKKPKENIRAVECKSHRSMCLVALKEKEMERVSKALKEDGGFRL